MPVDKYKQSGFSLVEVVIGITTFAVALTIITSALAPQVAKSADPIFQVRATELAQSLFNEILGKYYDENTDRNGGRIRCNEDLVNDADEILCTVPNLLGPDTGETSRPSFDDVDDYNGYGVVRDAGGEVISYDSVQNSLGQDISTTANGNLYSGFGIEVDVFYDSNMDGVADATAGNIKLVRVKVRTPADDEIVFASYKHNY